MRTAPLTDEQIARIAVMANIRRFRKQARVDRLSITITDPRLIDELRSWSDELNASATAVVESILYEAFFPGEKTPAEMQANKA